MMNAERPRDEWAIDGKFAAPEEHAQLLVIGGGPAGLAAATEAARLGVSVVLIDENPVPAAMMGLDVPLFYGQRMNAAVQEDARMVERLVASSPALEAAFDAGVDVRLGVIAWGMFANGPALNALPARVAGLSDGSKSWMCGFDALILATGARDLVLGFEGIDMPGVMGVRALQSLLARYDAFDGKKLVVLGSGNLAANAALLALDKGVEVAALIEVLSEPQAGADLVAALHARGVAIRTGTCLMQMVGNATGVSGAIVSRVGVHAPETIECDTICLAIGVVPAIELAASLGCRTVFSGDLGGHVPLTGSHGATSLPGVFCTGDCAGLVAEAVCETRAIETAQAALAWLRNTVPTPGSPPGDAGVDTTGYRLAWMRALLESGGMKAPVCLCEDVDRGELLGIQPPRYLGCRSDKMAARDANSLLEDGPLNPDQIKRLTRAGMGPCQGRRCREQIAMLLSLQAGAPLSAIPLASYRAPVRPLPLSVLADPAQTQDMREQWDVWFGIRTQWIPYDVIGTEAEAEFIAAGRGGNMHA
jgi:thioredoxin reductase